MIYVPIPGGCVLELPDKNLTYEVTKAPSPYHHLHPLLLVQIGKGWRSYVSVDVESLHVAIDAMIAAGHPSGESCAVALGQLEPKVRGPLAGEA